MGDFSRFGVPGSPIKALIVIVGAEFIDADEIEQELVRRDRRGLPLLRGKAVVDDKCSCGGDNGP